MRGQAAARARVFSSDGGYTVFGRVVTGMEVVDRIVRGDVIQSITIMVILVYVDFRGWLLELGWEVYARILRDLCIWATVAVTVISGYTYVRRAMKLYRSAKIG